MLKQSAGDALVEVIIETTSGPWEEENGEGGTIKEFNGLLIVKQTQAVHREIKQLLEMMRAADREDRGKSRQDRAGKQKTVTDG